MKKKTYARFRRTKSSTSRRKRTIPFRGYFKLIIRRWK